MAEQENVIPKGLEEETSPIRMNKGQVSRSALKVIAGQVMEECNRDLRWPYCMNTFKQMEKDATIAPALTLMEMMISKVDWVVKVPEGYEEELKDKVEFLKQVQSDMSTSWYDFIRRTSSFNRWGFAPMEKVYRRRYKKNGSKFNDGLVGVKDLVLIDQDSIDEWLYDESGRELIGLTQWDKRPRSTNITHQTYEPSPIRINRNKFMLFRADPSKNNPEGTSPLKGVYVAWRFKTELEKFESVGISQDIRGLKVFKIPARYMREDATEDEKLTYKVCQDTLTLLHKGEQSGVIIPSDVDFETNSPLFDFKLESVMGQSTYDINEIIGRYR